MGSVAKSDILTVDRPEQPRHSPDRRRQEHDDEERGHNPVEDLRRRPQLVLEIGPLRQQPDGDSDEARRGLRSRADEDHQREGREGDEARVAHERRHGCVDDDVARHVQVRDAFRGVDHRELRCGLVGRLEAADKDAL